MKDKIAPVQAGYDRWAVVYDHDANPLQGLEEPVLRGAVGDPRGLTVLDLGCGTGRHSVWLAEAGASVTAVDFSEGMLVQARRKPGAATARFLTHDLLQPLPFDAGAFDLVVSGLVLEHLRDLNQFFQEAHRVLRLAVGPWCQPCIRLCFCEARRPGSRTRCPASWWYRSALLIRSAPS